MNLSSLLLEYSKPNSCGLLVYFNDGEWKILLVHPGGPYYEGTDYGSWSFPKGINEENQSDLDCAKREFEEEVGLKAPTGKYIDLGSVASSYKSYHIFAVECDAELYRKILDGEHKESNTFELDGEHYPEIDKVEFYNIETAKRKLSPKMVVFIERLEKKLE